MLKWRRGVAFLLSVGFTLSAAVPPPPAATDGTPDRQDSSPAILRIRVVAGDGAVHTAGVKSTQPIILELTDETGRPVPGVSVSVQLPESGPTGRFATGLRTEIGRSGDDGRVAIRGIEWSRQPGSVMLRVTAHRGEARAGILLAQYIHVPTPGDSRAESPARATRPAPASPGPSRAKWMLFLALAGGAAAGGVAAASRGSAPGAPPPTSGAQNGLSIGSPSLTVGQP